MSKELPSRYQVLELLGAGGMGKVFRAEDRELGRVVALKLLHGSYARHEGVRVRFQREARILARVRDPHLVEVFDLRLDPLPAYLAMELVEGRDLQTRLQDEGPLPPEEVARLAEEVAGALGTLHDHGVLHRDLKPSNVMQRARDGSFVVMDLGLAMADGETRMTASGELVGTPIYCPPELLRGGDWSPAGDQYQLACVLFEAAAGCRHVEARTPLELASRLMAGEHKAFPGHVPEGVRAALTRAMAQDPAERFTDVRALARAVAEGTRGAPTGTGAMARQARGGPSSDRPAASSGVAAFAVAVAGIAGVAGVVLVGLAVVRPTTGPPPAPTLEAPAGLPGVPGEDHPAAPEEVPLPEADDAERTATLQRLREAAAEELERARFWVRGPGGEPVLLEEGVARTGAPFLDLDPDRAGEALWSLDSLRALVVALGTGPPPPPEEKDALVSLDQLYLSELGLRPLVPFLEGPRPGVKGELPPVLRALAGRDLGPDSSSGPVTGWRAEALASLAELSAERAARIADYRTSPLLREVRSAAPLLPALSFSSMVGAYRQTPSGRRGLARFLRQASEAARRMVHAGARALREQPEGRRVHTYLLTQVIRRMSEVFLVDMPPELVLGRVPTTPEEWMLVAAVLDGWERERDDLPDLASQAAGLRLPRALAAVERATGEDRPSRMLRELARVMLLDALVRRRDLAAIAALDRRVRADGGFLRKEHAGSYLRELLELLVETSDPGRVFSGAEREALRDRARTLAAEVAAQDPRRARVLTELAGTLR